MYPTDVAKMVQSPIFHVNGDDPEACVRVARLALAYRQTFHKDVVVDLVCYRRHGHNEGDDPSYTQPLMYQKIDDHRSVRTLYTEALVARGDITDAEAEQVGADFHGRLQSALDETRSAAPPRDRPAPEPAGRRGRPARPSRPASTPPCSTRLVRRLGTTAGGLHASTRSSPASSTSAPRSGRAGEVDWSLAEALAFGSLLLEGTDVRITGQDTRRGTFSQRHAVLVDYADRRRVHAPGLARRVGRR